MNVFGEQYAIENIYEFSLNRKTIYLPKRVIINGIIHRFMLDTINYTMGDELILSIDGKQTNLSKLYLSISSSTPIRTRLPNSYRLLVRMIYHSYRMLIDQDKFTYEYLVQTYSKGFLGSRETEANFKSVICHLVNELTRDPSIDISTLCHNINNLWNKDRNANIILDSNGKFVVDKSVFEFASNSATNDSGTPSLASNNTDCNSVKSSNYATFFEKHYSLNRIQQLPNGSYIPLLAFVDEMIKRIEIPSTFDVCNDYRTKIAVIHNGNCYDLSSDYEFILEAYDPKRPLTNDLISIIARVYQILNLYTNISEESLMDLISDQSKGSPIRFDDDITECIKYSLSAHHDNPFATIFDMVMTVNRYWNEDKDDILIYDEESCGYIVDENAAYISNELIWGTLKSCIG